jgi:hypothetical protein
MIEAGEYRVRLGKLVIDENNNMWLECELRERPFGTLMLPMGQQPMDRETAELEAIKNAVRHYVREKFGMDIVTNFIDTRDDDWFWGHGHIGDDDSVKIYRSTIAAAVTKWLSVYPE